MEETRSAYQHIENRCTKELMGPGKFHQRRNSNSDLLPSKSTRAVRVIRAESESSSSESDPRGSNDSADRRRVCATTAYDQERSKMIVCHMRKLIGWSYVITETDPKRALTMDR